MMQEMIDACHEQGIAVALYCSLIFDRYAADTHPEWRMRHVGRENPWRRRTTWPDVHQLALPRLRPLFHGRDLPHVGFRGHSFRYDLLARALFLRPLPSRFDKEVGGEIPATVNWLDEKWVAFQRCRERWLVEFAHIATSTVRQLKRSASVEHQSSSYPLNWMFGVVEDLVQENDFLQGDFYGDQLQGSFVRKLLDRLTPHRPFGYETSFSVTLQDHTAMKSEAHARSQGIGGHCGQRGLYLY